MTDRYRMEYINCEVSAIIDTVEDRELTAEEITHRLNHETRMHNKWKTECQHWQKKTKETVQWIYNDSKVLGSKERQKAVKMIADELGIEIK